MALTLKSRQSQRWNHAPWSPMLSINAASTNSVPASQDYCPDTDTFTPDYTLTPLVLQPDVTIFCNDPTQYAGHANRLLSNVAWFEVTKEATRQIVASPTPTASQVCGAGRETPQGQPIDPYDVTSAAELSDTAGRLIVKRNFPPGDNVTLLFTAQLVDPRTNQTHELRQTFSVSTIASWAAPTLCLDCPSVTSYNPVRSGRTQTINAALMLGGKPCPPANCLFRWEVWDGAAWHEYGSALLDYFAEVSADSSSITIDRSIMGEGQTLRCSAYYDRQGDPASAPEPVLRREFSIERVLRGIDLKTAICNLAQSGSTSVAAKAMLSDGQGLIDKDTAEAFFDIRWKTAPNSANLAAPAFSVQAYGSAVSIPTDAMAKNSPYGMITECEVVDRGPLKAWADSDGSIITDADGAILLIN